MNKVMTWLEEDTKGILPLLGYALLAALLVVSLDECVRAAMINWGIIADTSSGQHPNPFSYMNWALMGQLFVIGPVMEELMFRFLPLALVIAFVSKSPGFVFGSTIVFAVLFGAIHPAHYGISGRTQVAIAGIFFGIVFLKCGGLHKRFFRSTIAAILAHGASNLLIILYELWEYYEFR